MVGGKKSNSYRRSYLGLRTSSNHKTSSHMIYLFTPSVFSATFRLSHQSCCEQLGLEQIASTGDRSEICQLSCRYPTYWNQGSQLEILLLCEEEMHANFLWMEAIFLRALLKELYYTLQCKWGSKVQQYSNQLADEEKMPSQFRKLSLNLPCKLVSNKKLDPRCEPWFALIWKT